MVKLSVGNSQAQRYGALAIAIVLVSSMLTLYASGKFIVTTAWQNARFSNRDYVEIPFDTYDAMIACREEAREQLGSSLLRSSPDWRSTRFEPDRQTYLTVLQADVRNLNIFEEAYVYCYIDPNDYVATYIRAYDSKQRPLISGSGFVNFIRSFGPNPHKPAKS